MTYSTVANIDTPSHEEGLLAPLDFSKKKYVLFLIFTFLHSTDFFRSKIQDQNLFLNLLQTKETGLCSVAQRLRNSKHNLT